MAPPEQITAPAPQELLKDAALAGAWILDPSRSTVSLKSKILGLAPVNGLFRQVAGTGTITPAGEVSGAITVVAAPPRSAGGQRRPLRPPPRLGLVFPDA
jgi:polyisoprenoid-binding protein YceI